MYFRKNFIFKNKINYVPHTATQIFLCIFYPLEKGRRGFLIVAYAGLEFLTQATQAN